MSPSPFRSLRQHTVVTAILGLALLAGAGAVQASQVRARTLPEMVATAGSIFAGHVQGVEYDRLHGLPVTRVTFQVTEGLRGVGSETLTLTFPGGVQENGFPYRINGLVPFGADEEIILLTYPASAAGLTSPVGLYQGRFDVRPGPAGLATVVAAGPRPRDLGGPVPLDDGGMSPSGATAIGRAGSSAMASETGLAAGAGPRVYARAEFMTALRRLVDADDEARSLNPGGTTVTSGLETPARDELQAPPTSGTGAVPVGSGERR